MTEATRPWEYQTTRHGVYRFYTKRAGDRDRLGDCEVCGGRTDIVHMLRCSEYFLDDGGFWAERGYVFGHDACLREARSKDWSRREEWTVDLSGARESMRLEAAQRSAERRGQLALDFEGAAP